MPSSAYSNKMAATSFEPYFLYNAIAHAPLVAPTPLMIIHGTKDTALLPEYAELGILEQDGCDVVRAVFSLQCDRARAARCADAVDDHSRHEGHRAAARVCRARHTRTRWLRRRSSRIFSTMRSRTRRSLRRRR